MGDTANNIAALLANAQNAPGPAGNPYTAVPAPEFAQGQTPPDLAAQAQPAAPPETQNAPITGQLQQQPTPTQQQVPKMGGTPLIARYLADIIRGPHLT